MDIKNPITVDIKLIRIKQSKGLVRLGTELDDTTYHNLTSCACENVRFSLKNKSATHQKFATLSSNKPLENGKMRWSTR